MASPPVPQISPPQDATPPEWSQPSPLSGSGPAALARVPGAAACIPCEVARLVLPVDVPADEAEEGDADQVIAATADPEGDGSVWADVDRWRRLPSGEVKVSEAADGPAPEGNRHPGTVTSAGLGCLVHGGIS